MQPSEILAWVLAIVGWLSAAYLFWRLRQQFATFVATTQTIAETFNEANELLANVYRVRLSCPACPWVDTVVRESRDAAILEGNRRITVHNDEMGHILSGEPLPGYYRGEPLN